MEAGAHVGFSDNGMEDDDHLHDFFPLRGRNVEFEYYMAGSILGALFCRQRDRM